MKNTFFALTLVAFAAAGPFPVQYTSGFKEPEPPTLKGPDFSASWMQVRIILYYLPSGG